MIERKFEQTVEDLRVKYKYNIEILIDTKQHLQGI